VKGLKRLSLDHLTYDPDGLDHSVQTVDSQGHDPTSTINYT